MIKKTITYKDWDENVVTEDFYFNVSEAELMELEVSVAKTGFMETVQAAVKAEEGAVVIDAFKRLIKISIGKREGKLFIKNDEIVNEFMQTNAYSALFLELITNTKEATAFVNGIMPKDLADKVANNKNQLALDMEAKINEMKLPDSTV